MPLTQLSTLVLPAPFGPISANSSPAATASETRSSTVRPPKRRVRPSMSSSAIPSPAAAILLDVAIASSLAALAAEIELLHVRMLAQALSRAVEHDAAVFHDIAVVGDVERNGGALLHDQNGDAELAPDFGKASHQVFHQHGGETEREFVDQQEFGPADEAAGDGQHLPLAAGKKAADAVAQVAEPREELVSQRLAPPSLDRRGGARNRRDHILGDGEIGKYLVTFGHQHDAAPRVLMRGTILDALALESDRPFGDARIVDAEEARDGPQCRGLAGPVRSQQRNDAARFNRKRDALHGRDGAVIDHLELLDRQQSRGHLRDPDAGRCLKGHSRK